MKNEALVFRDPRLSVSERLADLLARMTLEEKCEQLSSQIILGADQSSRRPEAGHVRCPAHFAHVHERQSPAACAALNNKDQALAVRGSRLGIPVLLNEESLHGALWGDAAMFPQSIALAATWNPGLINRIARIIGVELRAVGVRQTFSPVINLGRDPRWGRAQETYGEDPFLSAKMAVSYVTGIEETGVVATPKHFVDNYGDGGRDSHAVYHSQRYLRENDFVPFEAAVCEGKARGIMASYNSLDGIPCSCNRWLLTDVLRDDWGFDGIVVSDYGGVGGVHSAHRVADTPSEAAALCLEAGMDVELPDGGKLLIELVRKGRISRQTLDRAVRRVLKLKFELGLFEDPFVDPAKADRLVRNSQHIAVTLEAARQCMTLLKNDGGILPLSKDIRRVGLFGPVAEVVSLGDYSGVFGGSWGGPGVSPAEGIRRLLPDATVTVCPARENPLQVARNCQVAIVFVTIREEEGGDRSNLSLPGGDDSPGGDGSGGVASHAHAIVVDPMRSEVRLGNQIQVIRTLAATGIPLVVVVINGAAITMGEWIDQAPAVLEAWYAGEQGGTAIAETLFGDFNPAGRLPVTFPKSAGQVPLCYDYRPSGRGYAYNDDDGKPLFCFGFGLSYTTFTYENLALSSLEIHIDETLIVSIDVTNTGARDGDEVVQLYISDLIASVAQPMKSLKGFQRIHLGASQRATVVFKITRRELELWDRSLRRVVEPGEFKITIGASSQDIRAEAVFRVIT
jgi:beta-glucosidase